MNNSNTSAILRSLIIYAVCVPLAIFVGFSLANPLDSGSVKFYGALTAVLVSPIFLRWHRELLVFSWSASITCFLLPGSPSFWLVMVCISLGISILERILSSNMQFIRVPQVTMPLLLFLAVVLFTAELTGGVGIRAFGSAVYGGKKYVLLFISVASYFAVTSRPIPKEKAALFVTLFFGGHLTALIGNFYIVSPSWLYPLFLVFPPPSENLDAEGAIVHLPGVGAVGLGVYLLMMAKFGPRGILLGGKLWRLVVFVIGLVMIGLGGYRSSVLLVIATFLIMFCWQGLHRTPVMLVMLLLGLAFGTALVPLAHNLPVSFQRSIAFIPGLDLNQDAISSADGSTNWRIDLWTALLPQIPPHLLLGKGLSFSSEEFDEMMNGNAQMEDAAGRFDAAQNSLALSADYHNGMLSLIIPFGIWGVITVLWFLAAGTRALYMNAKYGPDYLNEVNSFLFTLFFFEAASFVSCVGGLQITAELASFIGYLGLSIALNNGVCKPEKSELAPVRSVLPFRRLPSPRPAFQR